MKYGFHADLNTIVVGKSLGRKWVKALRSGKYEQGAGVLRDANNRYCCLGVLCDIIDPNSWEGNKGAKRWHGNLMTIHVTNKDHEGYDGDLADRNDGIGAHPENPHSFEQIAQIIEKEFGL